MLPSEFAEPALYMPKYNHCEHSNFLCLGVPREKIKVPISSIYHIMPVTTRVMF